MGPRRLAEGERGGDPGADPPRLEASLGRLGTDYVDHYQLHRPDPTRPLDETLGCLAELRHEGKIREIGCTDFTADELSTPHAAAVEHGVAPYASVQNHYSLLTRTPETDGVLDACAGRHGVRAVLPARVRPAHRQVPAGEDRPEGSRLPRWGERAGRSSTTTSWPSSAADAWAEATRPQHPRAGDELATSHPLVASVIAGATKPDR